MPFNSTTINLILSALITAVLSGGYFFWKNSVEQEALNKMEVLQLQQQVKDQQKYINDIEALNKDSNEIIANMKTKENDLNTKLRDLESYLDNHKDASESSEVLKRTFKELSQ
jgi:septal ring factor EnvC (AmiA/AmiB activator)